MLHQEEDIVAIHQPLLLCLQQQSHAVVFVGQNHNYYTKQGFYYSCWRILLDIVEQISALFSPRVTFAMYLIF